MNTELENIIRQMKENNQRLKQIVAKLDQMNQILAAQIDKSRAYREEDDLK
jgi:CRISPR/Cas system CSM-associated protein Csm2 small subunit